MDVRSPTQMTGYPLVRFTSYLLNESDRTVFLWENTLVKLSLTIDKNAQGRSGYKKIFSFF